MATDETVTLDPIEFAVERTELNLDKLGIRVRDANWGDADMENFMVRQAFGEIPADAHPPNRNLSFKLRVESYSGGNLAKAAHRLQQKIGILQRERGFIRRDLDTGSGFVGSVAAQVRGAVLTGLDGWMMASRKRAPEVTLNIVAGPYLYGVTQVESGEFKDEASGRLIFEMADVKGSAPGLIRVKVKNLNAAGADWRSLIASLESRDHPQNATKNTTAILGAEAQLFTKVGGSVNAEFLAKKVVANAELTAGWLTILESKLTASGHLQHKGVRRLLARIYDPAASLGTTQLRLSWRALGTLTWTTNTAISASVINEWSIIDLGEVRPEQEILGTRRWEFKIEARTTAGSKATIRINEFFFPAVEQYLKLRTADADLSANLQSQKSPATVVNDATEGEGAWVNPANAAASDNVYTTVLSKAWVKTNWLKSSKYVFALPGTATPIRVVFECEIKSNVADGFIEKMESAILKAGVKQEPFKLSTSFFATGVDQYVVVQEFSLTGWTAAQVNAEGFGFSMRMYQGLEQTFSVDHVRATVYYTEGTDENRVCFAGREIELRSDGVFRQHPTEEVWGRGVPDGELFYAPPSLLEERAMRALILPSRGDLATIPDSGFPNKLSAKVLYYPGYLYTSEAA